MTARPMLPTALGLGLVAGCGNDTSALPAATATGTATTQSAVTPASPTRGANAYIGSIAVDPMILGTGLGLFRLDPGAMRAERVVGTLSTSEASGEISSNLVVRFRGPGDLLVSGHPKGAGALPENLGLIRSRDAGKTWEPISEVGQSDHRHRRQNGPRPGRRPQSGPLWLRPRRRGLAVDRSWSDVEATPRARVVMAHGGDR